MPGAMFREGKTPRRTSLKVNATVGWPVFVSTRRRSSARAKVLTANKVMSIGTPGTTPGPTGYSVPMPHREFLLLLSLQSCSEDIKDGGGGPIIGDSSDSVDSAPLDSPADSPDSHSGADTAWDPSDDSDRDGISDGEEGRSDAGSRDTDGDGSPDYRDFDSDHDGISDSNEGAPMDESGPPDTDADGTDDYLDPDSDDDGLPDNVEGTSDWDGDGLANWRDPLNNGAASDITLVAISTDFTSPIGIDFHESAGDVVTSVNYSGGSPYALETVAADGSHTQFSALSDVTDEVKIATVRSGGLGGFSTGELFVGNGVDGQIVRVSADGSTVTNPWVDLPGEGNGLMRGSLYVDRTGVFGGNLIVATTDGEVWSIDSAGNAVMLADISGVHLEGLVTVPDAPARYGPIAGTVLVGAENEGVIYVISPAGSVSSIDVDVAVEDIDIIVPDENFFGVNYGSSSLLGATAAEFLPIAGDILLTNETVTKVGLFRLYFDGAALRADELTVTPDGAAIAQWEHVTFAAAGIQEIPY